jgi:hypothetical protein
MSDNKQYVEPIGFNGSKGEWVLIDEKNQFTKWRTVNDADDNEVANLSAYSYRPTAKEAKQVADADAALIVNCKEMAKALQGFLNELTTTGGLIREEIVNNLQWNQLAGIEKILSTQNKFLKTQDYERNKNKSGRPR